jgi:hypothetical protein
MIRYDLPDLWDARARATVELAALVVGTALMPYTGLDPAASFEAVFGEQHVRFNNSNKFMEYSTGDKMIFHRNRVYLQLVIHALGHTFDRQANLRPQIELAAGRFNLRHALLFPGMHPPSMDGGNEPKERWANSWEAFCCQTFAPNIFGVALEKFMTENMARWCALAMGRVTA